MDYIDQLKNRDVIALDGAMERLRTMMQDYLALQKELYYGASLTMEAREQYIEAIQNYQHLIDHMWRETLMVADTSIGRQVRERSKRG